jgi:hypothetical protein
MSYVRPVTDVSGLDNDFKGERRGTRTLDPMIKRKVFKAFSIMISTKAVDNLWAVSCSNEP